jgi:hypothetical protein
MKINTKRAQESLVSTKLIGIILLVLVILVLAMFLFKPQIMDWIRNLPGYETPQDQEIDFTNMPADEIAKLGCNQKIAVLGSKDISYTYYVDLREVSIYDSTSSNPRKIIPVFDVYNPIDYVFKIRNSIFKKDIILGHIQNNRLSINSNIILKYNLKEYPYNEIKKVITLEDLNKLDKSVLFGKLVLCKVP